jgi:hypothetical protein
MKKWVYLVVFAFSASLLNAQESHPPQNRGIEGMFYWSESQNKYVRGEDAMINVNQYGSMWGASNTAVVNYLTGKVFTRKTNGKGNEYAKCEFVDLIFDITIKKMSLGEKKKLDTKLKCV